MFVIPNLAAAQNLGYSLQLQRAYIARVQDTVSACNGAPSRVYINKPLKNFRDVLWRIDTAEWVEAYRKEEQGFQDWDALKVVEPPKGAKILEPPKGAKTRSRVLSTSRRRAFYRNEKYVVAYEGISKSNILIMGIPCYSRHPRSGSLR